MVEIYKDNYTKPIFQSFLIVERVFLCKKLMSLWNSGTEKSDVLKSNIFRKQILKMSKNKKYFDRTPCLLKYDLIYKDKLMKRIHSYKNFREKIKKEFMKESFRRENGAKFLSFECTNTKQVLYLLKDIPQRVIDRKKLSEMNFLLLNKHYKKGQSKFICTSAINKKIIISYGQIRIVKKSPPPVPNERRKYPLFNPELVEKMNQSKKHYCRDSHNLPIEIDIFAVTPPEVKEWELTRKKTEGSSKSIVHRGFQDTWDDPEGYYNFAVGEIIADRFEIFTSYGRGVFSSVVRARDLHTGEFGSYKEVAIKMIRSNETMSKAAQQERIILNKLSLTDAENKRHIIKLETHFIYRDHLCLVFEQMDLNLRLCIRKFGREVGLNIHAVRAYTIQLLIALKHLKNNGILHADIKPDNILVNETRTVVKLCDFGSAMLLQNTSTTPYLVSRFYRAPEIILGLPYDTPIDIWSVGCVIFELFTGRILFPGKANSEMIKMIMDIKGIMPKKMVRNGMFSGRYFDLTNSISMLTTSSNKDLVTATNFFTKRSLSNMIGGESNSNVSFDIKEKRIKVLQVADLLDKMFTLDPEKRLSPIQALKHAFCEVDNMK